MKILAIATGVCLIVTGITPANSKTRHRNHNSGQISERSPLIHSGLNRRSQLPPDIFKSKLPADILRRYFPNEYSAQQKPPTASDQPDIVSTGEDLAALVETNKSLAILKIRRQISNSQRREIICLALNVYHESRGSIEEDQKSVAYVTLNRVRAGGGFGNSVCNVVTKPAQFSWLANRNLVPREIDAWNKSQQIAVGAYLHFYPDPTNGALYFWQPEKAATYSWMRTGTGYKRIGAHIYMTAK